MERGYGNFIPEANNFPSQEYETLTTQQNNKVQEIKVTEGWFNNGYNPRPVLTLNNCGYALPFNNLIVFVRHHTSQTNTTKSKKKPITSTPIWKCPTCTTGGSHLQNARLRM